MVVVEFVLVSCIMGMAEWRNGWNGYRNGQLEWRNGGWNGGMVEWWEWLNGGNGGNGGMAKWQKEWQNGKMAEMDTYVLFMVHADTDDTDDDDTLIFYSIESNQTPWKKRQTQ